MLPSNFLSPLIQHKVVTYSFYIFSKEFKNIISFTASQVYTADYSLNGSAKNLKFHFSQYFPLVFEHKFTFSPNKSYFGHFPHTQNLVVYCFSYILLFMILPICAYLKPYLHPRQAQNLNKIASRTEISAMTLESSNQNEIHFLSQ